MDSVSVKVDTKAVMVETLHPLRVKVTDYPALLKIAGNFMRASIKRTFLDEGSPAGSWPRLALSTLRKKGYTAGHKMLVMRGILSNSFTYRTAGNTLTIGTGIKYAGVHQYGSADRSGGSVGAQARVPGRSVGISAHDAIRIYRQHGREARIDKNGTSRNVRVRLEDKKVRFSIGAHTRFQNIPARPFLVFRPEDPAGIASGIQAYLVNRSGAAGKES